MKTVFFFSSIAARGRRLASGIFGGFLLSVVLCAAPAAKAEPVFIAEYYNERIFKYDTSGVNQGLFASLPPSGARFYGLAVDSTGRVYAGANAGGGGFQGVRRFASDGTFLGNINMSFNGALAVGANDVLFAGNYSNGQITRYAADGTNLGLFATASSGIASMAFDAAGNLYTTNEGTDVHKFSATGQDLGVFVTGQNFAEGVVINAAGELLVVNRGNTTVRRYSATGQDLGVFATSANGLTTPTGIAVDGSGSVYVANLSGGGSSIVRKFFANGQDAGTFATGASISSVGIYRPVGIAATGAPEPASLAYLLPALGGIGVILRRRRLH